MKMLTETAHGHAIDGAAITIVTSQGHEVVVRIVETAGWITIAVTGIPDNGCITTKAPGRVKVEIPA